MSLVSIAESVAVCAGRRSVLVSGVFDVLHDGHRALFEFAAGLGEVVVCSINSDESAAGLGKGPGRPVNQAGERAAAILETGLVAVVVEFGEATPERVVRALRPAVYVKGGDYAVEDLPEAGAVTECGGTIVIFPRVPGFSSTQEITSRGSSAGDSL